MEFYKKKNDKIILKLKSNFLLWRLFFLSDHNSVSNEGNSIILFMIERYCWVEKDYKKKTKIEEEQCTTYFIEIFKLFLFHESFPFYIFQ